MVRNLSPIRALFGGEAVKVLAVAAVVGLTTGLGALVFRRLVDLVTTLSFGGSSILDNVEHMPWALRLGLPVLGMVVVANLTQSLAKEAKGHGVPEVMEAVAHGGGKIRPRLVVVKSIASAVNIGTGGSVGREGPIVQIGSALGSTFGQVLGQPTQQLRLLVACGAAAGIAATFNAPMTGVVFAVEIILGSAAIRTFSPIVVSSVVATAVSRWFLGAEPAFDIPAYALKSPAELGVYVVLGLAAGILAVVFIRVLYGCEDFFERLPVPRLLAPVLGGLILGVLGLFFPGVYGLGYETIDQMLGGELVIGALIALMLGKLVATSVTLAGGGSGGIFAPSLFLGAALGGCFGVLANQFAPWPTASVGAYVLVGMGAVVAAGTHAPLTAILVIFELTGDYAIILPLMLACIIGSILSVTVNRGSIYSMKLERRGIHIGAATGAMAVLNTKVRDLMREVPCRLHEGMAYQPLADHVLTADEEYHYVVDEEGKLLGVIALDDIRAVLTEHVPVATASDCMRLQTYAVRADENMDVCLSRFAVIPDEEIPVVDRQNVLLGVLRRRDIIGLYNRELLRLSELGVRFVSDEQPKRQDYVELPPGHVVDAVPLPAKLAGSNLRELDLRRKHGIMVIGLRRGGPSGGARVAPDPDAPLPEGIVLVVTGPQDEVRWLRDLDEENAA